MVVKYRRKMIDDQISDRTKNILEYIWLKYGIVLEEQSFCPITAGEAPIEVIRSYIESQGGKDEQSIQVSDLSDQGAGDFDP